MASDLRSHSVRAVRIALIAVLVVLAGLAFVTIKRYFSARLRLGPNIVEDVTDNLANRSGLSVYLVRAIVIVVTIPFFIAIVKFGRRIPLFWVGGIWKPRLWLYTSGWGIVIVLYIGFYNYAIYWVSQGPRYYNWCAHTPDGRIFVRDSPGKDPIYGIDATPCPVQDIGFLRGDGPKTIQISNARHYPFFSFGRPTVWYSKSDSGQYVFYDRMGSDPTTNEPLRPVDQDTVTAIIHSQDSAEASRVGQARESQAGKYVNAGISRHPGSQQVALLLYSDGGEPFGVAENAVGKALSARGLTPVALFRPAFVQDGKARELLAGDWRPLDDLDVRNRVNLIVIGTASVTFGSSPELDNLVSAHVRLDLNCLNPIKRQPCGRQIIDMVGAGFSQSIALDNSIERAKPQLQAFAQSLQVN